ncbi:sigma-70 family RNA polymerase sigma factor [Cohnella cholangitidis]|uniref:Sigma-70 family RNA polymerase sigma factor n=1 Tax=Cohnella cholangitidis TaxID=2598458 RepID=A0A7G5C7A0_9BACL|nr:sigma-70 family RNA polymerase sigma factor [Cohnella cholangitidis]
MDLVRRLADKDETALRELMAQYSEELLRTAYLLVKDKQTAEEAVMDSFLQAYNKILQLKEPDKLRGWLLRIVVNRCRMRMRTWSWSRLLPFAQVEPKELEPSPEDLLLMEWRNERLSAAIHKLDYIYREVIALYYYNGLSVLEIAEHIGSNENTVKARLSRGRSKLKRMLEEEGDGDEAGHGAGVY